MNKSTITILVFLILAIIVALVIIDFMGDRPDKRGGNPYEYNTDQFKSVDPSLIHYRETKNIPLGERKAKSIDIANDEIYLTGNNFIMVILPDGIRKSYIPIEGNGECIKATDKNIIIGFKNAISVFDHTGKILNSWNIDSERTIITSIAVKGDQIFIADAGNRRVLKYTIQGVFLGQFEGKRNSGDSHGFIVPSPNFDLAINPFGELWVVNPGMHSIENYSDDGEFRGFWSKSSMEIDGFTGCCNPAEIAIMNDGSFITGEKGLVRIKIYDPSGKLLSVVAPPEIFKEDGRAPEITFNTKGIIYSLDFDRNVIRLFEK